MSLMPALYTADSAHMAALELAQEAQGKNPVDAKKFDDEGGLQLCAALTKCFRSHASSNETEFGVQVLAALIVQRKAGLVRWNNTTETLMDGLLAKAKKDGTFLRPGRGTSNFGEYYPGVEMLAVAIESAAHHAKVPLSKVFNTKEGESIDKLAETQKVTFER